MKHVSVGLDVGGTKCALSVGMCAGPEVEILHREEFPTAGKTWQETLAKYAGLVEAYFAAHGECALKNIGISCGGPLDSRAGVVLSPPNLPGWDRVPAVEFFRRRFNVPVRLQNDANACAYA